MKTKLLFTLGALCGAALTTHAASIGFGLRIGIPAAIEVREEPPPPRAIVVERTPPPPGPGFVWVPGHYVWEGHWTWVAPTWVQPPEPGAFWVEGRWEGRNRQWTEGHWELPPQAAMPPPPPPPPGPPAAAAEIYVEQAPPPPQREVIVERDRPGRDYVWVGGYWGWRDGRHSWVAGHWDRPPHAHMSWVEPKWERRGNGYVFVEGRWK